MPDIFLTLGVFILSSVLVGKGILGIKNKKIRVAWRYTASELHAGTSARIWGGLYILVGIIFIISYVLIKTDYLYSMKFDLTRLW